MDEFWRAVTGYEGLYEVSDQGQVRALARTFPVANIMRTIKPRLLRSRVGPYGHTIVLLTNNGARKDHRIADLVMAAFVGPAPKGMEAVHKDDDQGNNRLRNLEYGPCRNELYFFNPSNSKLVDKQVREIRASSLKPNEIAKLYNITPMNVRHIRAGKTWKHVV